MTLQQWLNQATKDLETANITTARLDSMVLLCDELNTNSAQLLAQPEIILSNEQQQRLNQLLERRKQHEPLAYIRQKCQFYGREFIVNKDVLVPRPETETMIELAKNLPSEARQTFIDIGTGSGAIAITMACELGAVQVLATDISPACLAVARRNCVKHKATVDLIESNLIFTVGVTGGETILANLPYVPNAHTINRAATLEPKLAIFGGDDGLDLYRELFDQLQGHQGYVLTESLPFQHSALAKIAKDYGYNLETTDDFIQVFSSAVLPPV
ncbi:MAG: HemK/PrmC family methyltransferase [Candidatus Saccharimonadales bacterium]